MPGWTENTIIRTGSVTAPGAGAAVVTITDPPEGLYELDVRIALTGTAETALRNLRLEVPNGTQVGDPLPTLTGLVVPFRLDRLLVPAGVGADVVLEAIAAATAGAIYNVLVAATRVA